jgi:hypothetical protein
LLSLPSRATISLPQLIVSLHFNHLLDLKNKKKKYAAGERKHKKKSCSFATKNKLIEMNI